MARFGVNILKRTAFRGGVQSFGNTYYFETGVAGTPGVTQLTALVDDIVAKEKAKHATTVNFIRGRLWSQIGTPAQNQMLVDKALSGAGTQSADASVDRERAYLVRFRAGVDSLGRPVYLRKWFHLECRIVGGSIPAQEVANVTEVSASDRTAVEALGDSLKSITVGTPAVTYQLVSKNGREIDGATQAHRFLEHHQFGEEWRGV